MNTASDTHSGSAWTTSRGRRRRRLKTDILPEEALPAECDLVMKGGITSGIVYPRAIAEFARRFRLRSIGGASAGAIAAAAAAAAQYGKNNGHDGFRELEDLPCWLAGEKGAADTRLLRLFQPQPALRRLYGWLIDGLSRDTYSRWRTVLRWLGSAMWRFPGAVASSMLAVSGVFAGLHWLVSRTLLPVSTTGWVLLALLMLLAATFGGVGGVVRAMTRILPRHLYGICDGMAHDDDGAPALTPWLHGLLQRLAGRSAGQLPLTFGDLWGAVDEGGRGGSGGAAHDGDGGGAREHPGARSSARRDIDLRVMTTALSQGRPYSIPFEPGDLFHFDESEFRRLFPADVVDWMLAHPATISDERMRLAGRHPLPVMADLPILVAARMSLSFPLLIAAVPLYRCNRHTRREERVWFSDGGLCSNFPVHYFDAPLPSRPTFAINLTDDLFLPEHPLEPDGFVHLQQGNDGGQDHHVVDIEGDRRRPRLGGFLGAMLETLHNWSDNTQLRVPGFRDRVAHVRLRRDEGGLNLRMSRELILRVAERGRCAAVRLMDGFFPRAPYRHDTSWQNHRWVRFRTSFTLLEEALAGLLASHRRFIGLPTGIDALHARQPSYRYRLTAQRTRSLAAYHRVIDLAVDLERMRHGTTPSGDAIFNPRRSPAPSPRSQLRIRPRM